MSDGFKEHLVHAVDGVPETRGLGVVLIDMGRLHHLRRPRPEEPTVVFERRLKPVQAPPMLARQGPRAASSHQAARQIEARSAQTSPATEWMNLGLNCGGAVLAWIGIVGLSSLAPVTGGAGGFAAGLLYAGAAASTGQCVASVARTVNMQRGRADINAAWDANPIYVNTMRAADGISLIGAGGALKELKATNAILRRAGYSFGRARAGETISRPMRRQLTTALELRGGARVPGVEINRVVRQRLLDGAAGALGLFASGYSGLMNEAGHGFWDLVVWITEETGKKA